MDMLARMERRAKRKKKKIVKEKSRGKKKGKVANINFDTAVLEESSPIGLFEGDLGAEGIFST